MNNSFNTIICFIININIQIRIDSFNRSFRISQYLFTILNCIKFILTKSISIRHCNFNYNHNIIRLKIKHINSHNIRYKYNMIKIINTFITFIKIIKFIRIYIILHLIFLKRTSSNDQSNIINQNICTNWQSILCLLR